MAFGKQSWFLIFDREFFKREKSLFELNGEMIRQSNIETFSFVSLIMLVSGLFLFISSLLLSYKISYVVFSALFYSAALVLTVLFRCARTRKYSITPLMYIETLIINVATFFASLFSNADMHLAVSFTCMQIILPIIMLDKSLRINSYFILAYVVHTVLALYLKPSDVTKMDFQGTTIFTLTGLFLGMYFRKTRLSLFDKERILTFQRDTDVLTELGSRRALFADIEKMMKYPVLNVIMFDLDYFKMFNDTYGHLAGDDCLRAVSSCFKKVEEEFNIKFYRFGGEEFTALSTAYSSERLAEIAERTRSLVDGMNKFFIHGISGHVTVSAGYVTVRTKASMTAESYIKMADDALYVAKQNGRNRTEPYSEKQ